MARNALCTRTTYITVGVYFNIAAAVLTTTAAAIAFFINRHKFKHLNMLLACQICCSYMVFVFLIVHSFFSLPSLSLL